MKFILTADDYGVSPIIDDAIEDAVEKGFVTSVAAFANIPGNKEGEELFFDVSKVAALQKKYPHISVGLHLSLTSGPRVAEHATSLSPKVFGKRRRRFKGPAQQMGKVKEDHVYDEIKAQIRIFQDAGIEIQHFSDHHGMLSHTKVGRKMLYRAVNEYNRSVNRTVSIRNPLFISTLIRDHDNNLDMSRARKKAMVPLALQNAFRFLFRSSRQRVQAKYHMSLAKQLQFVREMNMIGIPTTDYFIDSFWGCKTEDDVRDAFNKDNFNVDPDLTFPLAFTEPTAEIMLHIAQSKKDFRGDYKKEMKRIKKRKGVDPKYVKGGRLDEARLLEQYLDKYLAREDRVSFKKYMDTRTNLAVRLAARAA